jgi:hypothetical protein
VRVTVPFAVFEYTAPGRYSAEVYVRGSSPMEMDSARMRLPAGRVTRSRRLPRSEISSLREGAASQEGAAPQGVALGEGRVRFLGSGLEPADAVRAGQSLTVDLHWVALSPLGTDYTVFVHLLAGYNPATGGPVWAQDDSRPLAGGHPTTRWQPGQVVVDRHVVDVPEGTPPGTYQVAVGLYDALTGDRLSVENADLDQIVIGEIDITY